MQDIIDQLGGFAPLFVATIKALAVLIVGWTAAGIISRTIRRRVLANDRIDNTIGSFAASLVRWLILFVVLIAILSIYGIEATSLVAVMGAGTLAIGLALQGTLADLAAGFMLILFRPYKLGQYVEIGGTAGTVVEINLFVTELVTPQNVQIIVPNGQAWGSVITNYSHHGDRRLDLTFGIDYGDDAQVAMQIILDVAAAEDRVFADPEPWVRVTGLGDFSVDITARLWCTGDDIWTLKFDLTKAVKEAFDAGGITIPYPHHVEIRREG